MGWLHDAYSYNWGYFKVLLRKKGSHWWKFKADWFSILIEFNKNQSISEFLRSSFENWDWQNYSISDMVYTMVYYGAINKE